MLNSLLESMSMRSIVPWRETLKACGRQLVRGYLRTPFRGKSRLRAITDSWLAPDGEIERVVIGPCTLSLSHAYEATRNMAYGVYERNELQVVRAWVRPGDTVLDIGANVGYFAAHLADMVGVRSGVRLRTWSDPIKLFARSRERKQVQ